MKKNLKICVEQIPSDEARCLFDMNRYERVEEAGFAPDLVHKRSAHISGAWRFAEKTTVGIPLDGADLTAYRYLTFAVFAVNGAGGSFSLFFGDREHRNGYECTLSVSHDGWNEYRVELPFMRAIRTPKGWDEIDCIHFDCVFGGQSNRTDTVLYVDSLFVWGQLAPPLYSTMPELKGAAAFAKNGGYAIVNRKRVALSIDGSSVKPIEIDGVWWLPMGAVATVMAHTAVADNKANTLTFTYRRKKYAFEADSKLMTVDGGVEKLSFAPMAKSGMLFFPMEFVRDFFRWRQIFIDKTGLLVLSNRKHIFDSAKDFDRIWQLIADMTFDHPTGARILTDLRKKITNPGKGRLLATYEELMQLRRDAKTDEALKTTVASLKREYGIGSSGYGAEPNVTDISAASDAMIAFSMLYRVTGDKQYCERAAREAEAFAMLNEWSDASMQSTAKLAFGMAIAYDWCHHVWSEARKAVVERAMLRNCLRPAVEAYHGKHNTWDMGSAKGAEINAGMLAAALALADIYPETTLKILDHLLRNVENFMKSFSPDGGFAEGVFAWGKGAFGAAMIIQMLQTACGTDYGLSCAPGYFSTGYFPIYAETDCGAWNYHNCKAISVDTSILSLFTKQTGNPVFAWWRRRALVAEKKAVKAWDVLFHTAVDEGKSYDLALDAVYRKAGLAMMRSDWSGQGMTACLHGGKNNERDGDLDAGGFILEYAGERFFAETGGNDALSMLMRRRAEGQNTLVVNPTDETVPDQNPGAIAPIIEMRSAPERAFAVVDMTRTNDGILRAKRGLMLDEHRTVAVIQDEMTLAEEGIVVWNAYTPAEVCLNKSGRVAKLLLNGKTLVCKICGIGAPARFVTEQMGESGLTRLQIRIEAKDRIRMAVVCYPENDGTAAPYEMTPMSKWVELS